VSYPTALALGSSLGCFLPDPGQLNERLQPPAALESEQVLGKRLLTTDSKNRQTSIIMLITVAIGDISDEGITYGNRINDISRRG
jgi:hypothetical protein